MHNWNEARRNLPMMRYVVMITWTDAGSGQKIDRNYLLTIILCSAHYFANNVCGKSRKIDISLNHHLLIYQQGTK